jgi:hypothetical protein
MQVARENKRIIKLNIKMAQENIKNVLADQFRKLKNFYTK